MARERKAKIVARKERKAERLKNKRTQGKAGRGTTVQEFSTGKKEIWVMPGAREQEGFGQEANDLSHDSTHGVEDVGELLSDNSSSPAALASIVS